MDIAHLFEDDGYQYVLLLVDVFSSELFTKPLKTRETSEVLKAFQTIVKEFQATIYELQTDREASFLSKSFQDYCKKEKILFRPKFGKNKASIGMEKVVFDYSSRIFFWYELSRPKLAK